MHESQSQPSIFPSRVGTSSRQIAGEREAQRARTLLETIKGQPRKPKIHRTAETARESKGKKLSRSGNEPYSEPHGPAGGEREGVPRSALLPLTASRPIRTRHGAQTLSEHPVFFRPLALCRPEKDRRKHEDEAVERSVMGSTPKCARSIAHGSPQSV